MSILSNLTPKNIKWDLKDEIQIYKGDITGNKGGPFNLIHINRTPTRRNDRLLGKVLQGMNFLDDLDDCEENGKRIMNCGLIFNK